MKEKLLERFNRLYPNKRLLAVYLNGFTHRVIYDDGNANSDIEYEHYSGNMPEGNWTDRAKAMFIGIGHNQYQGNAEELLYVKVDER